MHRWQLGADDNSEERKESFVCLVVKTNKKTSTEMRCPKKKHSITESKDTTFSEAVFFENVNMLCQQKRAF